MLRIFTLLINIIIPSMIYFDMVDPILMVIIGICYLYMFMVNFIGALILSAFFATKDAEVKSTLQERLKSEMAEDVNYHYRIFTLLIFESFTLYMIYPLSLIVSILLGVCMLFQCLNMLLIPAIIKVSLNDDNEDS